MNSLSGAPSLSGRGGGTTGNDGGGLSSLAGMPGLGGTSSKISGNPLAASMSMSEDFDNVLGGMLDSKSPKKKKKSSSKSKDKDKKKKNEKPKSKADSKHQFTPEASFDLSRGSDGFGSPEVSDKRNEPFIPGRNETQKGGLKLGDSFDFEIAKSKKVGMAHGGSNLDSLFHDDLPQPAMHSISEQPPLNVGIEDALDTTSGISGRRRAAGRRGNASQNEDDMLGNFLGGQAAAKPKPAASLDALFGSQPARPTPQVAKSTPSYDPSILESDARTAQQGQVNAGGRGRGGLDDLFGTQKDPINQTASVEPSKQSGGLDALFGSQSKPSAQQSGGLDALFGSQSKPSAQQSGGLDALFGTQSKPSAEPAPVGASAGQRTRGLDDLFGSQNKQAGSFMAPSAVGMGGLDDLFPSQQKKIGQQPNVAASFAGRGSGIDDLLGTQTSKPVEEEVGPRKFGLIEPTPPLPPSLRGTVAHIDDISNLHPSEQPFAKDSLVPSLEQPSKCSLNEKKVHKPKDDESMSDLDIDDMLPDEVSSKSTPKTMPKPIEQNVGILKPSISQKVDLSFLDDLQDTKVEEDTKQKPKEETVVGNGQVGDQDAYGGFVPSFQNREASKPRRNINSSKSTGPKEAVQSKSTTVSSLDELFGSGNTNKKKPPDFSKTIATTNPSADNESSDSDDFSFLNKAKPASKTKPVGKATFKNDAPSESSKPEKQLPEQILEKISTKPEPPSTSPSHSVNISPRTRLGSSSDALSSSAFDSVNPKLAHSVKEVVQQPGIVPAVIPDSGELSIQTLNHQFSPVLSPEPIASPLKQGEEKQEVLPLQEETDFPRIDIEPPAPQQDIETDMPADSPALAKQSSVTSAADSRASSPILFPQFNDSLSSAQLKEKMQIKAHDPDSHTNMYLSDDSSCSPTFPRSGFRESSLSPPNIPAPSLKRIEELEAELEKYRQRIFDLERELAAKNAEIKAMHQKFSDDLHQEHLRSQESTSHHTRLHQQELSSLEAMHREAIAALKAVHLEELNSVRKRASDAKIIDQLAEQVESSAGSLKLLHHQLIDQRHVVEVGREAQLEARERLLAELEGNARKAQKEAETEIHRLQGLFSSMEGVMKGLRGHSWEERERLKHEHDRLEGLQAAVATEAEQSRIQLEEERRSIKERQGLFVEERRRMQREVERQRTELDAAVLKLQEDRSNFAELQVAATKAAEMAAHQQRQAQDQLELARRDLEREAAMLEEKIAASRSDLMAADSVRHELNLENARLGEEKRALEQMAFDLEQASAFINQKSQEVDARSQEAETLYQEGLNLFYQCMDMQKRVQLEGDRISDMHRNHELAQLDLIHEKNNIMKDLAILKLKENEVSKRASLKAQDSTKAVLNTGSRMLPPPPENSGSKIPPQLATLQQLLQRVQLMEKNTKNAQLTSSNEKAVYREISSPNRKNVGQNLVSSSFNFSFPLKQQVEMLIKEQNTNKKQLKHQQDFIQKVHSNTGDNELSILGTKNFDLSTCAFQPESQILLSHSDFEDASGSLNFTKSTENDYSFLESMFQKYKV